MRKLLKVRSLISVKPPDVIARRAQPDVAISSCKNGDRHAPEGARGDNNADVKTFCKTFCSLSARGIAKSFAYELIEYNYVVNDLKIKS